MRTIETTFTTFGASMLLIGLKGESNATEILIDCADALAEYQGTMAAMSITGPDGTVYPGDISLDEDGVVHWVVAERDCDIDGHGSARVDLVDDNGTVVASAEADTMVIKTKMQNIAPDQIENWTDAASVALQEVRAALVDLINTDSTATANEAARQLAETGRISAETLRASAETSRASAETARATAETARASAETARATAETARASAETSRASAETARVNGYSTIEANAQAALSYIGPSEASSTASAAHAAGSYFIYNGKLYQATSDIAIGDTIASGTNCAQVPGGAMGEVSILKSAFANFANMNQDIIAWVRGSINGSTGAITSSGAPKRCRTGAISLGGYAVVTDGSSRIYVHFYSGSDDAAGWLGSTGQWLVACDVKAYAEEHYPTADRFKLVGSKKDDSQIGDGTSGDVTECTDHIFILPEYAKESDIEQLSDDVGNKLDVSADVIALGTHESSAEYENLDELAIGVYRVANSTAAGRVTGDKPASATAYRLIVSAIAQGTRKVQIALISSTTKPKARIRWDTTGTFTPWVDIATSDVAVLTTAQDFTEEQKSIARANIDAADATIVGEIYKKVGGELDITEQFVFADGSRVNYITGQINNGASSSASGFVDVSNYTKLTLTAPVHLSSVVTGMAFYTDANLDAYDSGVQDHYNSSLQEATYEIRTVTVPKTAKYIRVSWWATTTDQYQETDFSCIAITEPEENAELPEYYFENDYITDKVKDINTIAITIGRNSLRNIFITDYHLEDNARKSPKLISYLIDKTGIQNVVFGGDAINHDYTSKVGGYDKLCEFIRDFKSIREESNLYLITGNHEMNNADLQHSSVELSKAVAYNLFNEPINHKIKTIWETQEGDSNAFYVDDAASKIRFYGIDCTSGASIQKTYLDRILPTMYTVPAGYSVVIYSHAGMGTYTTDDTVYPPVYTVQTLDERFEILMNFAKAMNDGYQGTVSGTINGTTYTWNVDFSNCQRQFICAIVGHSHRDGYYIVDNRFPVIFTVCDTGAYRDTQPWRIAGTITEQAFDVVQIDVNTKRIYCTRIGFGSDRVFSFGETGAGLIT